MVEGIDGKWLLGQGIAVFFAVVLLAMFWKLGMGLLTRLTRMLDRVEEMHRETVRATGRMVGAFRWFAEVVRQKLGIEPPADFEEGLEHQHHRDSEEATRRHRRAGDAPGVPPASGAGRAPDTGAPTPKMEDFFHE